MRKYNEAEAIARVEAYLAVTRDDFVARLKRAPQMADLECGVLCGPTTDSYGMPEEYTSHYTLFESAWFIPQLMMHLPRHLRWDYVKRFERALLELVLKSLGGKIISISEGNAPGYDAIIQTDAGVHKIEIKATDKHAIFIEGGRYDMTSSGLSATESDAYLILSRDQIQHPDGTLSYLGKIRICFTHNLIKEYLRISQHSELAFQPDKNGPGSRGVKMDPRRDLEPHIWVGDIECKIDKHGNSMYNLAAFTREPMDKGEALRKYRSGVRAMEKFDPRYKDQE